MHNEFIQFSESVKESFLHVGRFQSRYAYYLLLQSYLDISHHFLISGTGDLLSAICRNRQKLVTLSGITGHLL